VEGGPILELFEALCERGTERVHLNLNSVSAMAEDRGGGLLSRVKVEER
jgi:hypothetical protein